MNVDESIYKYIDNAKARLEYITGKTHSHDEIVQLLIGRVKIWR